MTQPGRSINDPERSIAADVATDSDAARSQLLIGVTGMLTVAAGGFLVYQLATDTGAAQVAAVASVAVAGVVGSVLVRRGQLVAAATVLLVLVFSASSSSLWFNGRVDAPGATTYLIVVLIAAMTLGTRTAIVVTLLCVASLGFFAVAEAQGWSPDEPDRWNTTERWFIAAIQVVAAGWLVAHSSNLFQRVLDRLGRRNVDLAASERRYARLLDQSPDVIVEVDAEGVVREVSASVERVFGYRPEEIVGNNFTDLGVLDESQIVDMAATLDQILAEPTTPLPVVEVRHRDGTKRQIETSGRVVEEERGDARLHLVVRDVTARAEAEEQRELLRHQLDESRRLEGLGRLAGGVAHDFNNLLLIIGVNTEVIADGGGDSTVAIDQLRDAQASAAELVRQLLAFSGQAPRRDEVTDVARTIERTLGLLRRLVPPGIDLDLRITAEPVPVRFATASLEQVVVNLIMNAVQALGDNGRILLEVVPVDADGFVRLTVADDGPGMSEATLERIFEPFYSERQGGTGLGLAGTHGNVTQGGGRIDVTTAPGEGARFDVYLPAVHDVAEAAESGKTTPPRLDGTRILLVDDDDAVRESIADLLRRLGAEIHGAVRPYDALDIARSSVAIDVLVTDIRMPDMNGVELSDQIRRFRPGLPVVLMSGYAAEVIDPRVEPGPGVALISKPFEPDRFVNTIVELTDTVERP